MMKINKIFVLFVLLSFSSVDRTYAQGEVSNGYNPLSLRQVHESYLMWKKTLWRRVDLKEKQNKPFFAINREISKIIFDAVQRGVLIRYNSDSVTDNNVMAREDFLINVQQEDLDGGDDDFGGGFEDDPFAAAILLETEVLMVALGNCSTSHTFFCPLGKGWRTTTRVEFLGMRSSSLSYT